MLFSQYVIVSHFITGVSKSVINTLSNMDLDKINLELIEALLEWIVNGDNLYLPGW